MNVLLTGGTGYVASHTAVVLAEAGHRIALFDNLCNSQPQVAQRLQFMTGQTMPLIVGDVRDTALLIQALKKHQIDAVFHFAGLKAVGESVAQPIDYYANNVHGSISVVQAMHAAHVKTLVFSSSATVYGCPQYLPIDEAHPTKATNPYGRSKLQVEEILADVVTSDPRWRIACLRYFNPVGAHESGQIGEDPAGVPNNLMPYVAQVASGKLPYLSVFGNDYPTPDGTGVRDYIHVADLAVGHLAALNFLARDDNAAGLLSSQGTVDSTIHTFNLGRGQGHSVFEIIKAFELASGKTVKYQIASRRPGDIATCYAEVKKAEQILGWKAKRNLQDMCVSAWLRAMHSTRHATL
ncbi:MAG: UDP-glucose 4-epimerase GalE [Aeromicrobium sp.]|nr:UDP-glucose 4-epimerase GalE [Burkholderiales bacterium]